MMRWLRYCLHGVAVLMMAVFLAACGGSDKSKTPVSSIVPAVNYAHTVAIKGGGVYAWGVNTYGQVGTGGDLTSYSVPQSVNGLPSGMTGASAGGTHTVAFKNHSGAYAWGNNAFGQLGDGTQIARPTPVPVKKLDGVALTNITAVSAGGNHSLALDGTGAVWAWGNNASGQLGDPTAAGALSVRSLAVQVQTDAAGTPLSGVTMIAAGGEHNLALKSDGTVLAWGSNAKGQLGNGTTGTATNSRTPKPVLKSAGVPLDHIKAIAAGGGHSLALDDTGAVWAWGLNSVGQLGNGATLSSSNPDDANQSYAVKVSLTVSGTTTVDTVNPPLAAGLDHSLVIGADGNVYGWGLNFSGQLGNGQSRAIAGVSTPVKVQPNGSFPSGVTTVVAVGNHSLAFDANQAHAWAWGENTFGQLGKGTNPDGTTTDSALAVAVTGFP